MPDFQGYRRRCRRSLERAAATPGGADQSWQDARRQSAGRRGSECTQPAVALHETMRLHITKENELLLPVMDDVFSDDEQSGVMRQMLGYPPPDLTSQILLWIFRANRSPTEKGSCA